MERKSFWNAIPDDCKKAISELKRLKVYGLLALDYEETFADVYWLVLHEVDLYEEGEFCREASRSVFGEGDPQAMNLKQAKAADKWLIKYLDLYNKYKADEYYSPYGKMLRLNNWGKGYYYYGGQL